MHADLPSLGDRQAKIEFIEHLPLFSLTVILVCLFVSTAVAEMTVTSGIMVRTFGEGDVAIRNDVGLSFEENMLRSGPVFLKELLNDEDGAKAYVILRTARVTFLVLTLM